MSEGAWNPRYVAFARANGNTPEAQITADEERYPGGLMTGFICWIGARWREFATECGVRNTDEVRLKLGNTTDARFDTWLDVLVWP